MDYGTMEQKRLKRVAEQLWSSDPQSPLVEAYRHDRGSAVGDFCTDLEDIVHVIDTTRGQLDRRQKILDAVAEMENKNSILVLFENRYPDGDLWGQLLNLTEIVDREVEADSWICPGCEEPIEEGEHSLVASLRIVTRMPIGYKPTRALPDTQLHVRAHNPPCLAAAMAKYELLTNVFT